MLFDKAEKLNFSAFIILSNFYSRFNADCCSRTTGELKSTMIGSPADMQAVGFIQRLVVSSTGIYYGQWLFLYLILFLKGAILNMKLPSRIYSLLLYSR